MKFVRKSTDNAVVVGPFVSVVDGKSLIAPTPGTISCHVIKGATAEVLVLDGTTLADTLGVVTTGVKKFQPGAATFDTVGPLTVKFANGSEFLPFSECFFVLDPAIYDWYVSNDLQIDTAITLLRAAMDKASSTPSGVGTYLPSTDSLEALRDRFDASVSPAIASAGSLSGSGFLSTSLSLVRRLADEPSLNAKYSDGDILNEINASLSTVMADLHVASDHPFVVRLDINIVSGKQTYTLPPNLQKFYYIAKINSSTGMKEWEVLPNNQWNFDGRGFVLEGNTIRLTQDWKSSYTLEVAYVPSADTKPHKADAASYTTTTLTLPSSVTDGELDTRPHAYAGYLLRILSSTDTGSVYTQERIISAYDNQTRIATINEAFSPALVGTITYEVLPVYAELLQHVVALHAAKTILSSEGSAKKVGLLTRLYAEKMRALKMQMKRDFRIGRAFENADPANPYNRSQTYGYGTGTGGY